MDPLGEILSVSFCHVTNHPKTWWLKTTTIYLASDSVGWNLGWAQLLLWAFLLVSAGLPLCVCGQLAS